MIYRTIKFRYNPSINYVLKANKYGISYRQFEPDVLRKLKDLYKDAR